MAVDIVPRLLPKKVNMVLGFSVNLLCILFSFVLAYFAYKQMIRVKIAGQISPAMELPMWIAYLAIPFGTVLMLIRYAQQLSLRAREKDVYVQETLD